MVNIYDKKLTSTKIMHVHVNHEMVNIMVNFLEFYFAEIQCNLVNI